MDIIEKANFYLGEDYQIINESITNSVNLKVLKTKKPIHMKSAISTQIQPLVFGFTNDDKLYLFNSKNYKKPGYYLDGEYIDFTNKNKLINKAFFGMGSSLYVWDKLPDDMVDIFNQKNYDDIQSLLKKLKSKLT